MKGFFLNDLYTIKRPMILIIGIISFLSMFFMMISFVDPAENTFTDCRMFGGMFSMMFIMIVIAFISDDEKSGWMKCACILPASRKAYVCEKFLISLIVILLGAAVVCTPTVRLMLLQENLVMEELWLSAALALFVPAFMLVFIFPLSMRFGVSKGASCFLLIFLIGATLIGGIAILSATSDWFMKLMDSFMNTDCIKAALYLFMGAIGLFGLTLPLSIAGFKNRSL